MEEYIWHHNNNLIDDGNIKGEDRAIVEKALHWCVKHVLIVNCLKGEFDVCEALFLKCVHNSQQVNMDPSNVQTMFR